MAKLTAPLLSLGASGKIADTLVMATWKGIPYARQYVIPANPKTTDQTNQRNAFKASVAAWRNYITDATVREAWRVWAGIQASAMSNFNAAVGQLNPILLGDADASFATSIAEASQVLTVSCENMDDGGQGDEAGDFQIWTGTKSTNMTQLETKTLAAGDLVTSDLGDDGDVIYVEVRKDDSSRSGIMKLTLTA